MVKYGKTSRSPYHKYMIFLSFIGFVALLAMLWYGMLDLDQQIGLGCFAFLCVAHLAGWLQ